MTCVFKRVLPFALTLTVGLVLGSFFNKGLRPAPPAAQRQPVYAGESDSRDSRTFNPREVDQKARILRRAEPRYTDEARENLVEGTVVLRAVFSSTGQVTNIRVVSELPYGLTDRAVEAARQIEFRPAMKDGRPVSQYIQIEYKFSLY